MPRTKRYKAAICVVVLICSLQSSIGCAQGDDPETVALITTYVSPRGIKRLRDENGHQRIYSVGLPNNRQALEILPQLGKLEHLTSLSIGYKLLKDEDLKALPELPKLQTLTLAQTEISDGALEYIAKFRELKELELQQTKIRGHGFEHLSGLSKLEKLYLTNTPLDDSAMPHIARKFKMLRRIDLGDTQVTANGLMQLVDLHWLVDIGTPNDIVGPRDDPKEQAKAKMELARRYVTAYKASKRKAREAGEKVPPDHIHPFGALE
jgi:hypothetical protein